MAGPERQSSFLNFNPEPWVRSALWIALALLVVVFAFRGDPIKINIAGAEIGLGEKGLKAEPGDTSRLPVAGDSAVRRSGTTYVSVCPRKLRAIAGSCTILEGGGQLQNFGPEQTSDGSWQFVCVWSGQVAKADARAVCVPN